MTAESVYIVNSNPDKKKKPYNILGPRDDEYEFEKPNSYQYKLLLADDEIMHSEKEFTFGCYYILKFKSPNGLNKLNFYTKTFSGYKLTGDCSNNINAINWTWEQPQYTSACYILKDKNNKAKEIARISGLSLDGQESGMICISNTVPYDFQHVILIAACMIWKEKE